MTLGQGQGLTLTLTLNTHVVSSSIIYSFRSLHLPIFRPQAASFWKIQGFDFFPYKSIWEQIWSWLKIGRGHPGVIIWTNYDWLWLAWLPNAIYQVSWQQAYWFRRRRFLKGFDLIRRPSWSSDMDLANKLLLPHPMDAPHEIWLQSAQ